MVFGVSGLTSVTRTGVSTGRDHKGATKVAGVQEVGGRGGIGGGRGRQGGWEGGGR